MASIYSRAGTANFWLKFRNPVSGTVERVSLETADAGRADIIRSKVEALAMLANPEWIDVEVPAEIRSLLPSVQGAVAAPSPTPVAEEPAPSRFRRPVREVVDAFARWCRTENSEQHARSKLGYMRRLFGEGAVPYPNGRPKGQKPVLPFLGAACVEDVSVDDAARFIESVSENTCTRRHVREAVHQLWEFALKREFLRATNFHSPNPMSALPCYSEGPRVITFLTPKDVRMQWRALKGHRSIQLAVALMILGGLRRSEALWMRWIDVNLEQNFMSVVYKQDGDKEGNTLKTGQRAVTLDPRLRKLLLRAMKTRKAEWIAPNSEGKRFDKDNFSAKLAELNKKAGLDWACNDYRHTYASDVLSRQGGSIFKLSKEMGSSIPTLVKHYAAYIRPDQLYYGKEGGGR